MFTILFQRNHVSTGQPLPHETHCLTFEDFTDFHNNLKTLSGDKDFTVVYSGKSAHYAAVEI